MYSCIKLKIFSSCSIGLQSYVCSLELIVRFVFDYSKVIVYTLLTQPPLKDTDRKELECQFHSADYHMLTEVASGLRNATEYLVKV